MARPPSVLIVDDEEDIRFLLRTIVEQPGSGLSLAGVARSGAEALGLWREVRPDVVVLDERMPDASGLDVAAAMLAEDDRQAIVLFTAFLDAATERRAAAVGIRACVAKVNLPALPAAIAAALDGLGR